MAIFLTFVIFMSLRKATHQNIKGYKRINSDNRYDSIN